MIKYAVSWICGLALLIALAIPALASAEKTTASGTPVATSEPMTPDVTDFPDATDACDAMADSDRSGPEDAGSGVGCDEPASSAGTSLPELSGNGQDVRIAPCSNDPLVECVTPSTAQTEQSDACFAESNPAQQGAIGEGAGDSCPLNPTRAPSEAVAMDGQGQPVLAAVTLPPTVVQVYCQIPDVNSPDLRVVGTFVDIRAGYDDPTVTFTLEDLNGNVIAIPTGAALLPASNPVTAAPPYPNNWQWGPGGYAKLTVSAFYPSLDPGSYPDATSALTISCVPDAPTPPATATATPTNTPEFSPTPFPTRTAVGYTPQFTSIMKDTDGNTILDGDTVAAGTGVYDIAVISGLPPNATGSVYYWLLNECQFVSDYGSGWHAFTADAAGNATAPQSATFIVPVSPGGHYDWLVGYSDDAYPPYYLGGCDPETFYVVPPPTPTPTLTPFGDGSALIACFVGDPSEPGMAGYKINVNPLPASGSVEVNVTLLRTDGVTEHTTVTLPPGTAQDLEFYGAYASVSANLIYRDNHDAIYSVVNLKGACAVTPGATNTPTAIPTMTGTPTSTATGTATATPAAPPTFSATSSPTPVDSPTGDLTGTPADPPTATLSSASTSTPTSLVLSDPASTATSGPITRSPSPETTPGLTSLPNTGSGSRRPAELAPILIVGFLLTVLTLMLGFQRSRSVVARKTQATRSNR